MKKKEAAKLTSNTGEYVWKCCLFCWSTEESMICPFTCTSIHMTSLIKTKGGKDKHPFLRFKIFFCYIYSNILLHSKLR